MFSLSVVVPIFNEEDNVILLYKRLVYVLGRCVQVAEYEIIFVNDGSIDESAQRLASISDQKVKVVTLARRMGQSAAFDYGIRAAMFDTVATMDGDLQNDPVDFLEMLMRLRGGADFVQGWRTPREDPFSKRLSSIIANNVRRWVLKDQFHDISCSQRIFKKQCVKEMDFFPGAHRFLPYLVQEAGHRVTECKVRHHPRVAGYSKYGIHNRLVSPLKDLVRLFLIQKSSHRGLSLKAYAQSLKTRVAAYLGILGFLTIEMLNIHLYGYGDDEQWLFRRGERAYQIIKAVLVGQWHYAGVLTSGNEFWSFHPQLYGLINYWLVSRLLRYWGWGDIPSVHFLNLILATLALVGIFKLTVEMLGEEEALYSVFFMMFFPRFIAHAQYNSKDIPAMAAITMSMLYGYRAMSVSNMRSIFISGLWMGLAMGIHLGSLILLPVIPITMFLFRNTDNERYLWTAYRVYGGAAFLTLYILWPLLWVRPFFLFDSIRHFTGGFDIRELTLLYFGINYPRSEVPWHYYPFFLFACTPLLMWFFIGIGGRAEVAGWMKEKRRTKAYCLLLIWLLLPVLARTNPWAEKYNEMRHLFLSVPPLMILAGCGGKVFMDFYRNLFVGQRSWASVLLYSCVLAYFAGQIIPVHPYEGEYFNEAFRLFYPRQIEDSFEFPVWMTSYREAVDWLNANAPPHSVIRVPDLRISIFSFYKRRSDLVFTDKGLSNYTVVSGIDYKSSREYKRKTPVFEVTRYHSRLLAIFADETRHPVEGATPYRYFTQLQ